MFLIVVAGFICGAVINCVAGATRAGDRQDFIGVAKLEIELAGVSFTEVSAGEKRVNYDGNTVWMTTPSGIKTEYADVVLSGRGNATWTADKKPFRLKFAGKVDLLGLGKARKWILLSNPYDHTGIRNAFGFEILEMLGETYASKGKFVEVYADGEYQGLYFLATKVEIGKNRVRLTEPDGILAEIDNYWWRDEEMVVDTWAGDKLVLADAVNNDVASEAFLRLAEDFSRLERAASEGDYETVAELADIESLARYFLLSEFIANLDAYKTSLYLYRDGAGDKIHFGPAWDFDGAFGNLNWGEPEIWEDLYEPWQWMKYKTLIYGGNVYDASTGELKTISEDTQATKMFYELAKLPEFREEVRRIWHEKMQGRDEEVLRRFDEMVGKTLPAIAENARKWKYDDVLEDLERMRWWITERLQTVDDMLSSWKWEELELDTAV